MAVQFLIVALVAPPGNARRVARPDSFQAVVVPCTRPVQLRVVLRERLVRALGSVRASVPRVLVLVVHAQEWAALQDWFRLRVNRRVRSVRAAVSSVVAVSNTRKPKKAR